MPDPAKTGGAEDNIFIDLIQRFKPMPVKPFEQRAKE